MLREPQHERKTRNDIKSPPFVLSTVEGLREGFSATCHRFEIGGELRAALLKLSLQGVR
jgi:hypothetical protein